jgi:hypothetical protein
MRPAATADAGGKPGREVRCASYEAEVFVRRDARWRRHVFAEVKQRNTAHGDARVTSNNCADLDTLSLRYKILSNHFYNNLIASLSGRGRQFAK